MTPWATCVLHRSAKQSSSPSECYDLLIFDTPPVMSLPDALVVTRLCEKMPIVLVAELGRSDETIAAELLRRLASTHRTICGVVVNEVAASDTMSGTYSGYDWQTPLRIAPGRSGWVVITARHHRIRVIIMCFVPTSADAGNHFFFILLRHCRI